MNDFNATSIKSLEAFDVAWIEEAQDLSHRSLALLRPTIRAEGSENDAFEADGPTRPRRRDRRRPGVAKGSVKHQRGASATRLQSARSGRCPCQAPGFAFRFGSYKVLIAIKTGGWPWTIQTPERVGLKCGLITAHWKPSL